jgi:hypothetical protein
MSVLLALTCLAVVAISLLLQRQKSDYSWPPLSNWIALAFMLGAITLVSKEFSASDTLRALLEGFAVGAGAAVAGRLLDPLKTHRAAALAIGAAATSLFLSMAPADMRQACLAASVGAALAALVMPGRLSGIVAISVSAIAFAQTMGSFAGTEATYPEGGAILAIGIALIGAAGLALEKVLPKISIVWPILAGLLTAAVGFVIANTLLGLGRQWIEVALACVCGVTVFWLQNGERERDVFSLLVSTVIWIGLATVVFSIGHGFGLTLALVAVVGLLSILGGERALVTAGPLLGLAAQRMFREFHPDAAGALDIGQNYALIGLSVGALIPLLPDDWIGRLTKMSSYKQSAGRALWGLIALSVPTLIALFLAPKGLVGFVTGLGFCGFFAAMRKGVRADVLALAAGLGSFAMIEYDWLKPLTELTRTSKVHWLIYSAIGIAVVAGMLALLQLGVRSERELPEAA